MDQRTPFAVRRQLRLLVPLLGTWLVAAAVLAAAGVQHAVPLRQLFLDASYLGGQPWYTGILNEAGLVALAVGVTAAALGCWVAVLDARQGAAALLGAGAAVAATMLIDISIQFHTSVAPRLGISGPLAQAAIAALAGAWFAAFLAEIARTRWLVLVTAFGVLAVSAGIDTLADPRGTLGLWVEDGARLVGILTLAHYLVLTTVDVVRSVARRRPVPEPACSCPPRELPSAHE